MKDDILKRACVRSLEVIGEAVKNLPEDFKDEYPELEWKKIAGIRDKLIHHYFGVDWDIVWDVIQNKPRDKEAFLMSDVISKQVSAIIDKIEPGSTMDEKILSQPPLFGLYLKRNR